MSQRTTRRPSRSPAPPGLEEDGSDRAAYERRREQVRRAQRSHRERRSNYLKALEQEVASLRNQNSQNIQEYEEEIRMLHSILISSGLNPPPRQARIIPITSYDVDPANPSSYSVSKHAGMGQPLNLQLPAGMAREFSYHVSPEPEASNVGPSSSRTGSISDQFSPTALDKVHGINFVLGLEHRCMEHPDITRDELGTHCHMATHNLLAYAPANINGAATWEVPGMSVEGLLDWSTTLKADGIVTPVQAWYKLKQHPFFPMINEDMLQQLRGLLVNEVKCYGYGAVLDEQIWELAVQTVVMPKTRA